MSNQFDNLTDKEKRGVLGIRYKVPPFIWGLGIFNCILFITLIIFVKLADIDSPDDVATFAFILGFFLSSFLLSIISAIRDKGNWIDTQIKCWDKETK